MKKCKVILSVVVALSLVLSLAACGSKTEVVPKDVSSTVTETTPPKEVEVKETESVPVSADGFKHVEGKEITLTYIGDAISNNEFYATLNGYDITDEQITLVVSSDLIPTKVVANVATEDNELIKTLTEGFNYETTGDITTITFDRKVLDEDETLDKENIVFVINTDSDTIINIAVNMSI